MPAGRSAKLAQPIESVVPLKVPAPVPDSPTPGNGSPAALIVETVSVPLAGLSEPFDGAMMLCITIGGRPFMFVQVTVEVIRT